MPFTHDTEIALAALAALVNSRPASGRPDGLGLVHDLERFVEEWRYSGPLRRDDAELDEVRDLRARLAALWSLDEIGTVDFVNTLLREYRALPQLVRHDEWDWHLHATPSRAPLAARMAVEAAMAVVDVIRAGELDRLQSCSAEDCDDVLVDLSRNRSKRYCGTACANRTNVAAFRARRARA